MGHGQIFIFGFLRLSVVGVLQEIYLCFGFLSCLQRHSLDLNLVLRRFQTVRIDSENKVLYLGGLQLFFRLSELFCERPVLQLLLSHEQLVQLKWILGAPGFAREPRINGRRRHDWLPGYFNSCRPFILEQFRYLLLVR